MNIIIINNAAKESTVLKAFLPSICKKYSDVRVVFPQKSRLTSLYKEYDVKLCSPSYLNWFTAIALVFRFVLSKWSSEDYQLAKKQGKLSFRFFCEYYKGLLKACLEYSVAEQQLTILGDKTHVFSMWYAENAIAAAMIKKKHPKIVAASYAHSYEVDPIKNRYVGLMADRFKEHYLDRIFFISEVVMNNYLNYNRDVLSQPKKYKAIHFGSVKLFDTLCSPSSDGTFRILTCSGISSVKRLDLLARALVEQKYPMPVFWTVIGDGPQRGKVEEIVSGYDNINIKASIFGPVSNEEIHRYYANNPVDLFVNISTSEGLPVSIMEAMSYGVPALATDVGGNREIVNNDTGLLIKADITAADVAEALCKLMSDDLSAKRESAYHMWVNHYQVETNVSQLFAELEDLSEGIQ